MKPRSQDRGFSCLLRGIRLEGRDGAIVAYGTLDPKSLEKPDTFADWMKKTIGMNWG